jgi:hypothetical protein
MTGLTSSRRRPNHEGHEGHEEHEDVESRIARRRSRLVGRQSRPTCDASSLHQSSMSSELDADVSFVAFVAFVCFVVLRLPL